MTNVKKSVIAGGEFQAAFPLALNHPRGIVNCFSANNNDIFFVEEGNHCIRKISQGIEKKETYMINVNRSKYFLKFSKFKIKTDFAHKTCLN